MELEPEITQRLHHGVITALVHVASVRQASTAALAIEFDAAQRVLTQRVQAPATPPVLKTVFGFGLSLPTLKAMRQDYLPGDRRLLALRQPDLIAAFDAEHRADYSALVLAVAEAVLLAQIEDRPLRRIPRWERMAFEEIENVFKTGGWNGIQTH